MIFNFKWTVVFSNIYRGHMRGYMCIHTKTVTLYYWITVYCYYV